MFNYRYRQFVPPPFPNNQKNHSNNINVNSKINHCTPNNIQNCAEANKNVNLTISENAIFELFGLKIYFDDLLIICLLIFLFQEGIQDQYLFISLLLLLLS